MHDGLAAFVTALGLGLALLLIAGWRDRVTRRRAEARVAREIPGFDQSEPVPSLDADDLPRRSQPRPLSAHDAELVAAWKAERGTSEWSLQLADPRLATHVDPDNANAPLAIAGDAQLVVCGDGVGSIRELLPIIKTATERQQTLVVVAPSFSPDVLDTLAVNLRAKILSSVALVGTGDECARVADNFRVQRLSLAQRQSGAITGSVAAINRLVATDAATWVSVATGDQSPTHPSTAN